MKIKTAVFETSATSLRSCPRASLPEFALIGRSNVGKSSLVNLLTHRKDLARISNTPGKTQLINFFLVNDTWRLVDLPGYGYAKVGQQQRFDFSQAAAEFISKRVSLRCVFVLIDSRLPPQAIDIDFLHWLETAAVAFALIFTKMDKHSATQGRASVERFKDKLRTWRSDLPALHLSSAETGAGRAEILSFIDGRLQNHGAAEPSS